MTSIPTIGGVPAGGVGGPGSDDIHNIDPNLWNAGGGVSYYNLPSRTQAMLANRLLEVGIDLNELLNVHGSHQLDTVIERFAGNGRLSAGEARALARYFGERRQIVLRAEGAAWSVAMQLGRVPRRAAQTPANVKAAFDQFFASHDESMGYSGRYEIDGGYMAVRFDTRSGYQALVVDRAGEVLARAVGFFQDDISGNFIWAASPYLTRA